MRINKLFLVGLILLTIFTLSAVSAEDNMTTDSMTVDGIDDSIHEPVTENIEEKLESNIDDTILSAKKDSNMSVDFVTQDYDKKIYTIDEETDISADNYNQDYFRVKFPNKVTGNLSLYIDNKFMSDKKITGKTHYLYVNDKGYNLTAGNHTWMMKYSGDANYSSKSLRGTFVLNLKNELNIKTSFIKQDEDGKIHIIDENKDIFVNDHDSDYIRVKLANKTEGKLSLYIDKKLVSNREITGKTHYLFVNSKSYNLSEGNHTWKIRYSGDDSYRPAVLNGTFTLNPPSETFTKKNSKMEVYIVTKDDESIYLTDAEKEIGENTQGNDYFKVKFPKQVSGTLSLYIDGDLKSEKKISKKTHYLYANIKEYNLTVGKHNWEIKYSGDDEYKSSSENGTFTLNKIADVNKQKASTKMTVSKSKTYKTKTYTKSYKVTLKSDKKAIKKVYVYLTIKNKKYKKTFSAKTNTKGVATIKIKGLTKKGTYTATLSFKGNRNYNAVKNTLNIKITKSKCKITAKNNVVVNKSKPNVNVTPNTTFDGFIDVSEAFQLLNEFRAEKNVWHYTEDNGKAYYNTNPSNTLNPLENNTLFENTAKLRAKELVKSFSHTRPDGNDTWTAYPNKTDGYHPTGENIAKGHKTCKDVIEAWKESTKTTWKEQGHRINMLNPKSEVVGIAGYKFNGTIYWVQSFGMYWPY